MKIRCLLANFKILFLFLYLLLGSSQMGFAYGEIKESKKLFNLLEARFALMEQVALYKYLHQMPIYVPSTEEKILLNAKSEAIKRGLSIPAIQQCIQLQMQVAVLIQQQWHNKWQQEDKTPTQGLDLETQLRPQISQLTQNIIEQIAHAKPELIQERNRPALTQAIEQIIKVPYVSREQKHDLLQSLVNAAR